MSVRRVIYENPLSLGFELSHKISAGNPSGRDRKDGNRRSHNKRFGRHTTTHTTQCEEETRELYEERRVRPKLPNKKDLLKGLGDV